MQPISICKFDSLKSIQPVTYELENLERFIEFFAFTPPTVKKHQRGPFFSMAIYKPGTTRAKANVEALSGLVLDFDNTEDGQLKLPEFLLQLQQLKLIYLYYTTWSHTEVRHRWRLILPFAKAISTNFWHEVHARVLTLLRNPLGIDEAASRDVARMWVMPCKAADHPYEIGYEIDGEFLDPHSLPPVAKTTLPVIMPTDAYENTPEDIREALNCIDVNCDYDTWLKMGMALHHQLSNSGFAIWDAWSSRGEKYQGESDLQRRWQGFRPGHGITIATLFKYAKDAGWRPKPTANPLTYVMTNKIEGIESIKELEEADEYIDPLEKCLADLLPYAVADIFDFSSPILKSIFEWMQSVAPLPQPIFSLSASLSLLAFLKRDAVISATNLRTNLYILTIGPSRSGKNNGLNCIHQILDRLGLKEFEVSAFGSAQGLMKQLCEKDGIAYWIQDEMAHVFKNFQNKSAGTYETRLEQKILTLYNCCYQTTDKIKGEKVAAVDSPFLNIYGTTTENIIDNLNPEAAISGLLARFLVFWLKPDADLPDYITDLNRAIPQKLLDELRTINEQRGRRRVCLEETAKKWFKIFCKATQKNQHELCKSAAKVDSLVGNLPEQTIKLALLAAMPQRVEIKTKLYRAEYDAPIEITLKDIQWAASVALHSLQNNINIASMLTENKNEKYINKILGYLDQHKGKWVRRYDLCRCLRYALNARQLDDLLEPLLESREITKTSSPKGGGTLYHLNSTINKRRIA